MEKLYSLDEYLFAKQFGVDQRLTRKFSKSWDRFALSGDVAVYYRGNRILLEQRLANIWWRRYAVRYIDDEIACMRDRIAGLQKLMELPDVIGTPDPKPDAASE